MVLAGRLTSSTLATINQVDITPCPTIPCPFERNSFVNVTINYSANSAFTQAQTVVHGIIADVPVPFPLPDDDACHFMKCPINQGDSVEYKNGLNVLPSYPKITLIVKWELVSGSNDIVCFTIPVTITD
ncbi:Phosphatidylglycerol/phosphatidylinositol transfer protein [Bulinus truncatus]|nr:Phosphatidylglycerol/phosphatidylinositol transfer protein [Bulinus truncatus]